MPVFISYSHADSVFATQLAEQLVMHKAHIWIDQWELSVGDSLIDRIQKGIEGASGLLVILSKASVDSEWCKKELNSGLIRELEEKRVVVLPVLLEDCKIPLFLREKVYADFRTNFDDGLNKVLEAIAKVTSENLVRVDAPEFNVDWAVDTGFENDHFFMHLTAVEQAVGARYTVLTEVHVHANEAGTARYKAMEEAALDWIERSRLINSLCLATTQSDFRTALEDEKRQTTALELKDTQTDCGYIAKFSSRRLGENTGKDVIVDVAGHLRNLRDGQTEMRRSPTNDERRRTDEIYKLFRRKPPSFDHLKF